MAETATIVMPTASPILPPSLSPPLSFPLETLGVGRAGKTVLEDVIVESAIGACVLVAALLEGFDVAAAWEVVLAPWG